MQRPILLIAFILFIFCAVFYFVGSSAAVMPLLITGVVALVVAIATGR